MTRLQVILAQPRGFCAGVERAIEIVERALDRYGAPVYVRHEIVHNQQVVRALEAKGARFVDEVSEIPDGAVTIFSAHGVSTAVEREAGDRALPVIDATCPLVAKVHREGQRYAEMGMAVILIGHRGHPEVEGTIGRIHGEVHVVATVEEARRVTVGDPAKVAYVTQTTLSVDDTRGVIEALVDRFPGIEGPDTRDICYATQNRQRAVRALAERADCVLVVGAENSSNSNRLVEIARDCGVEAHLVPETERFDPRWIAGARRIGITAGASAPESAVQALVRRLGELAEVEVDTLDGVQEQVHFRLPDVLLADHERAHVGSVGGAPDRMVG